MFTKSLPGFAIIAASVRAFRENVSASVLNTSYTFVDQHGTNPTVLNGGYGEGGRKKDEEDGLNGSRRLNWFKKLNKMTPLAKMITIQFNDDYQRNIYALWIPSTVEFSPTVLMLNENTLLSGATVEDHATRLKGYDLQLRK